MIELTDLCIALYLDIFKTYLFFRAVKTARKSLRKESSAKWPMRASDFIQFEQWLEQKRIVEEVRILQLIEFHITSHKKRTTC